MELTAETRRNQIIKRVHEIHSNLLSLSLQLNIEVPFMGDLFQAFPLAPETTDNTNARDAVVFFSTGTNALPFLSQLNTIHCTEWLGILKFEI